VVGIARAGAIPGAVIASILRVDFCSMTISRRDGVEQVRENPTLRFVAPVSARGQRVLIVDETSSSGETLRMATAFICPQGYKPDFFFALETDQANIFPWDRKIFQDNQTGGKPSLPSCTGRVNGHQPAAMLSRNSWLVVVRPILCSRNSIDSVGGISERKFLSR